MNKNFTALMASIGTQLDVPKLADSKAKIVKTVSAGVLAATIGVAGAPANAQESAPSHTGEIAVGAGIGGVSGWGLGKILGANPTTRNLMGVAGAVLGGVIANKNAEAKDAPAAAQPQAGFRPLEADRTQRLTQLQLDALSKRVAYQSAFKQGQEAKLDRELNPGNVDFDAKFKRAATAMVQANRLDVEASRTFVTAFEAARDARYDVSAYAATYGKLKQPFNVNDQSYGQLAEQLLKHANIDAGAKPEVKNDEPSRGGLSI